MIYGPLADFVINPIITSVSNNYFIGLRIFTIVEYLLLSAFIYSIIQSTQLKKLIIIFSTLFLLFSIYDFYKSSEISFDSVPTGIAAILILFYSLYYLFEKIKRPDTLFLYSTPDFWIVVALIIFFSGTFFLFIFSQNNYNDPKFQSTFQIINNSFIILRNLLFAVAFLIKPEQIKQKIYPKL